MCATRHILANLSRPHTGGATGTPARDPALPRWITPAVITSTLYTFQPYYNYTKPLVEADAIEMLLSAGNLFRILSGDEEKNREEIEYRAG